MGREGDYYFLTLGPANHVRENPGEDEADSKDYWFRH